MTGYATYLATYQSGLTVAVAGCSRTGSLVLGLAGPGDDRLHEFALRVAVEATSTASQSYGSKDEFSDDPAWQHARKRLSELVEELLK